MSVIGIVGNYDDTENIPIIGNGKTGLLAFLLLEDEEEGKEIYVNFNFKRTCAHRLTTKEIFDLVIEGKIRNASIAIDEITTFLNSLGTEPHKIKFLEKVAGQSRKKDLDIYWTAQRFLSAPKRLRSHTYTIIIPYKTHLDDKPCYNPECKEAHKIWVYYQSPFDPNPKFWFFAEEIGQYYDTNEIIDEEFNVLTDKEKRKIAREAEKLLT